MIRSILLAAGLLLCACGSAPADPAQPTPPLEASVPVVGLLQDAQAPDLPTDGVTVTWTLTERAGQDWPRQDLPMPTLLRPDGQSVAPFLVMTGVNGQDLTTEGADLPAGAVLEGMAVYTVAAADFADGLGWRAVW